MSTEIFVQIRSFSLEIKKKTKVGVFYWNTVYTVILPYWKAEERAHKYNTNTAKRGRSSSEESNGKK